jgi:hypothetical protein
MQPNFRFLTTPVAVTLFLAMIFTAAAQDNWLHRTQIDANEAFQIPGAVLEPGTYIKRLAETTDRHVVQFFNEDETELIMTTFSVNVQRTEQRADAANDVTLEFEEQPAGVPVRLASWYMPGQQLGLHFFYDDEEQAEAIAGWNRTQVAESTEPEPVRETTESNRVAAPPVLPPSESSSEPAAGLGGPQSRSPAAEQETERPAASQQDPAPSGQAPSPDAERAESLPQTATRMPLAAVTGLIAIAACVGVGLVERRRIRH